MWETPLGCGVRLCTVDHFNAMGPASPSPHLIRFGVFELDLRSGELQKQGRKIRLEGQPVQILICLLETPGELVTRETLHQKLWSADTFVNFEQGLNASVKRLRQALSDSADNPRFVETIPRRG
jgi:DNA-binding winged helix-turn-helix (wHTH) protein